MSDYLAVNESGIITVGFKKSVFKSAAKKKAGPITGGKGNDKLYGTNDDDIVKGNAGKDVLYGGWGDDKLYGGKGDDKLYGGDGDDILYGEAGNDKLYGSDGDDTLYGGKGDDKLYGGDGEDIINGGKGDDRLYGGAGADKFVYANGDGDDRIGDYGSCQDSLIITKGTISAMKRKNCKNDLVMTIGKGSIRINGLGSQGVNFSDSFGTTGFIWAARDIQFHRADPYFTYVEPQSDFKGTLDAAMLFGNRNIQGYTKTIYGGQTEKPVTIVGSNWDEYFDFGAGTGEAFKGNTTIKKFNAGNDYITFDDSVGYKGSVSGSDVILNFNGGGKVKIVGAAGKDIMINGTSKTFK